MSKVSSIWQLDEFKPLYTAFLTRQRRFATFERVYKGGGSQATQAYDPNRLRPMLPAVSNARKRSAVLFQPVAGACQIDVALVPGGWLLDDDSQQHADAVRKLLKLSRWAQMGDLYVHNGAVFGQTTLKVVDNWQLKTVTLQPLRPDSVLIVRNGTYDSGIRMAIIISTTTDADNKPAELAEVIEPQRVRTFVNGKPHGVMGREATFENVLDEVNVIDQPFIDVGTGYGEPTFWSQIEPLEAVNAQALELDTIIRKHVEPQWAAFIDDPESNAADLQKSGDNLWWFPNGSDVKALVANLDIPGALALIQEVKAELKEGLFELLILKLAGMNRVAVPTVEIQLAPLTFKIQRIRRSLDCGLADAIRMAGRAYRLMNVPEFATLDDALLGFDDKRPVIALDALSKLALESAEMGLKSEKALMGDGFNGGDAEE